MKTKKCLLMVLFLLITSGIFACDVCGCYMGIIPNENNSSVSLYYRYRAYTGASHTGNDFFPDGGNLRTQHGNHGVINDTPSSVNTSYEVYRVTELRAKYFLHPRLSVNIILPYVANTEASNATRVRVNGIGDVNVFGGWIFISDKNTGDFMHRLEAGAGIKIPVGIFNKKYKEKRIDLSQQPGTGSVDEFIYSTYVVSFKKAGLLLNASYKRNGENKFNERIANSCTFSSSLFYNWSVSKNLKVLPSLQSYYEYSAGIYVNDQLDKGNLMNVLMLGGGVDVYYKSLGLSLSVQAPVHEETVTNGQASTIRTIAGLSWHFSQVKFPFYNSVKDVE